MTEEQARVLARSGNIAVTQLTGRAFPGLHLQGDTFAAAYHSLSEAAVRLRAEGVTGEAIDDLEYTLGELRDKLRFYEETLAANDIRLPYFLDGGATPHAGDG
ncbi:DUF6959 family protein [Dactylosporangium darangshiense]|uniref:DUF6959 family protein n=1 Tax=Dactylosporangium darangshiense TaxID=579108 RepID=UPI0031E80496